MNFPSWVFSISSWVLYALLHRSSHVLSIVWCWALLKGPYYCVIKECEIRIGDDMRTSVEESVYCRYASQILMIFTSLVLNVRGGEGVNSAYYETGMCGLGFSDSEIQSNTSSEFPNTQKWSENLDANFLNYNHLSEHFKDNLVRRKHSSQNA